MYIYLNIIYFQRKLLKSTRSFGKHILKELRIKLILFHFVCQFSHPH